MSCRVYVHIPVYLPVVLFNSPKKVFLSCWVHSQMIRVCMLHILTLCCVLQDILLICTHVLIWCVGFSLVLYVLNYSEKYFQFILKWVLSIYFVFVVYKNKGRATLQAYFHKVYVACIIPLNQI